MQKTKTTNRVLSLVLALLMVLSLFPAMTLNASAADVDSSALEAKIAEAEAIKNDDGKYTEESYNTLQQYLTIAKAAISEEGKEDLTQEIADQLVVLLQSAIDGLVLAAVDDSDIETAAKEKFTEIAEDFTNNKDKYYKTLSYKELELNLELVSNSDSVKYSEAIHGIYQCYLRLVEKQDPLPIPEDGVYTTSAKYFTTMIVPSLSCDANDGGYRIKSDTPDEFLTEVLNKNVTVEVDGGIVKVTFSYDGRLTEQLSFIVIPKNSNVMNLYGNGDYYRSVGDDDSSSGAIALQETGGTFSLEMNFLYPGSVLEYRKNSNLLYFFDVDWSNLVRTGDIVVDKTQLGEALEVADYIFTTDTTRYVETTIKAYQEAYNEGKAVYEDENATSAAVRNATTKLNEAREGLVTYKNLLLMTITTAESVDKDNLTDEQWNALQNAITAAKAVYEDKASTPASYKSQIEALQAAMNPSDTVDTTALESKIAEAEAISNNDGKYSEDSYNTLQQYLTIAKSAVSEEGRADLTQEIADQLVFLLQTAIDGLEETSTSAVDTAALESKIAEAEAINNDDGKYTEDSYNALQQYLTIAKSAVSEEGRTDLTQEIADQLVTLLQSAIDGLKKTVDNDDMYAFPDTIPTSSFNMELPDGTYSVPVYMYNAYDDVASMGNGAIDHTATVVKVGDTLTIHVSFHDMPFLDQYGHLEKLWYYTGTNYSLADRRKVTADKTEILFNEDTNAYVKTLRNGSFVAPHTNATIGCRVQVDAMGDSLQDARLVFDYAAAKRISDDTTSVLEDGVYLIHGDMVKVNKTEASMSDKAINHNIKLTVKDGVYTLTMNFDGLTYLNRLGYLKDLKYFESGYTTNQYGVPQGDLKNAKELTYQTDAKGNRVKDELGTDYPNLLSFPLIDEAKEDGFVPLQVFVPVMESIAEGSGTQPVFLKLDWATLEKTTDNDSRFDDPVTDPCADGHKTEVKNAKGATCTEAGYTGDEVCSVCGKTVKQGETIAAKGHTWGEWKVTKAATTSAEGEEKRTCSVCGETETHKIPKLDVKNPFVDVAQGQYYYDPVLWAVNHDPQITNGTDATHFSPMATCTRGQVVTFLWRAKGCPEPKSTNNPFKDVKASDYYYKAVLWANENGITNGTSATTFSPNAPCTRAHVVTFLWRADGQQKPGSSNNPFKDVPAGQYYTDAVLWAVNHNPQITNGTSATAFSPDKPCTRGQVVTFLYRDMA